MQIDLAAYLARIGLAEKPAADAAGLAAVQRAQRRAIPFENLDIPLGGATEEIADAAAYRAALADRFGIALDEDEAARLLAG